MESYWLAELKYAILSGTARKTKKLRRSELFLRTVWSAPFLRRNTKTETSVESSRLAEFGCEILPKELSTHVVYSVKCKTCKDEYVGETKRALSVRKKEHSDAIRLGQCSKSAIA